MPFLLSSLPLLFKLPIASSYDWCIAVASENIITLLWSFPYWDQSLLFADPWKCCSIYHPLSPSKIFLWCGATLKIRISFLQNWIIISVLYSSFGCFHGDTRQRLKWQSKIRKFRTRNVNFNYDSLSCETTQSLRFQMNGQEIVVVVSFFFTFRCNSFCFKKTTELTLQLGFKSI